MAKELKEKKELAEILSEIQAELKAPKGQFNAFGKYKYRSCEDILEAVKPLLAKKNVTLTITDDMILLGNRYYIKATVTLGNGMFTHKDEPYTIQSTAFAREAETKKGMDESQITGAASSYARKYALNGLLLIDDTKDADTQDNTKPQPAKTTPTQQSTPAPQTDKALISDKQVGRFFGKGKEYGWSTDELKTLIKTFGYEHTKDIKRDDYNKIIEMIEKGIADIPHDETKQAELLKDIKANSDAKVKEWELDALDKKALNLKLELNKITGDDIEYGAILAEFDIGQPHDLKDQEQKAELVTKLANKVIELGNKNSKEITT